MPDKMLITITLQGRTIRKVKGGVGKKQKKNTYKRKSLKNNNKNKQQGQTEQHQNLIPILNLHSSTKLKQLMYK